MVQHFNLESTFGMHEQKNIPCMSHFQGISEIALERGKSKTGRRKYISLQCLINNSVSPGNWLQLKDLPRITVPGMTRWQIESRNCRFEYFPSVSEIEHRLSYVGFLRSFQTKHLSVFKIIKNDPSSYPYPWPYAHNFFLFNHCVSYIKHFKWGDRWSYLTLSMLSILPDPPSKIWMCSKLIKWITAFGRVQNQLFPVNCVPSNWKAINVGSPHPSLWRLTL